MEVKGCTLFRDGVGLFPELSTVYSELSVNK